MARSRRTWRHLLPAIATAVLVTLTAAAPASAGGQHGSAKLRKAVTVSGVVDHLKALQRIADRNDDTRASGTPGYDQSAAYAERIFRRAGYRVTTQEFPFQSFRSNAPAVLQRVSPTPTTDLVTDVLTYSGSAAVTAPASVPTGSALGCAATDFGAANAGTIVLVSRGACTFAVKATNALAAGAAAVVIYNNVPGPLGGTLGNLFTANIAVVGVTQALGQELVAQVAAGLTLRVVTDTTRTMSTTRNVFAESRWGDPDTVVMAGAHLDSVPAGPGINDNGSGVATLLEVAEQLRRRTPNKVRFALWGAEEASLVGSTHYIANLPAAERDRIALHLNFDMVGSPNYVRFVYDGDNSAFPVGAGSAAGPAGSGAIEGLFHDYFADRGLASAETPFSGRSDYGPFIAAGVDIPSGGLFTGAEGVKTEAEAAVYGGTAGQAYDPCYHQACDTIDNVNRRAIDEMSDAVAHAIWTYANDVSSLTAPAAPATGTTAPARGGGGLHDDGHDAPM
ncbi:MAG TPA: M28 family metallopeptidase [Pilimelia sp.]|nr:M28 family metallopeptidase [Pilimelia sp.]